MGAISSIGRALPWHGRGSRFESGMVHNDEFERERVGKRQFPVWGDRGHPRTRGRLPAGRQGSPIERRPEAEQ